MASKGKKMRQEKQKRGEERKQKLKVKTAVTLLNPISKFCFLRMSELRKLTVYICMRRP